jgi:hypothetical protein
MFAEPPPFKETCRPGAGRFIDALFVVAPPGRPFVAAPGLPAAFAVPGRPFVVFGLPFVVFGRPFVVVLGRPFVVVLGRPFVVVPGRLVLLPLPGRPDDVVPGRLVDPCAGRPELLALWLGAEVCAGALPCGAGALACGAGALGFEGALGVFFWPQASAGTVITSKKRIDFRRALPFTMNFIANKDTAQSADELRSDQFSGP